MDPSAEPARLVNVRRFLMGLSADRPEDVASLLAPGVVYTVPGHSPLSGVYHGTAEVHDHIRHLFRATSGTFEVLKWVDWLVGLSHVAALQFVQAQGDGIVFRSHLVYVVETDLHDLITGIRVYFENESNVDAFFASLPPV